MTAVVFLGLMLLAPCLTIVFYPETGSAALRVLQVFRTSIAEGGRSVDSDAVLQWTGWIVLAWATGVMACSLRLITGWVLSLRLIRASRSEVPQALEKLLGRVHRALLTTRRIPRLLVGERVTGPVVFGWLRPVVLLPVSAVTGLNEEQLLAVLAHELAHVRRYDFLVNTLQRGVESVLFYHPAVWWLSGRIRKEREHCCDDLAVRVCGDRFAYAQALIELEKMRSETLALAVSGTSSLTERIRRMLGAEDRNRDWQPAMAALLLLGICTAAGLSQGDSLVPPAFAVAAPRPPVLSPIVEQPAPAATAPLETALGALEAIATAQTPQPQASAGQQWITTWGMAIPQRGFSTFDKDPCCNNQTVRMFMRVSAGGNSVRLRLSNAHGSAPLFLGQVRIGLHDRGSEIVSGSDRQVLFSGRSSVEIPIGQTITSDPVNLDLLALADVAISIYAPNETGLITGLSSSRAGYVVDGDQARAPGLVGAKLTYGRYWISGIEVLAPASSGAIAVVVDSASESGRSWPDLLASRVQDNSATKNRGVVLLNEVYRLMFPPYGGARLDAAHAANAFEAIVNSQVGVRYLLLCPSFPSFAMFLSAKGSSPEDLIIQGLRSTIELARSRGISIIGCTLPPDRLGIGGQEFKDGNGQLRKTDSVRVAVNNWMKSVGAVDGLVDLDAVVRDPVNPANIKPEFQMSNDPPSNALNDRAHQAIADAIDLSLFTR
jgi:beta-lactamase regulating signal transducer with metallopeptidase domain